LLRKISAISPETPISAGSFFDGHAMTFPATRGIGSFAALFVARNGLFCAKMRF
jgi:hypothetical protein